MGTIHVSSDIPKDVVVHQHPAICSLDAQFNLDDFRIDKLGAVMESQLSDHFHAAVTTHSQAGLGLVRFYYAARGAWRPDIMKHEKKFPKLHLMPDSFLRQQVCGHLTSTANCELSNQLANAYVVAALEWVRSRSFVRVREVPTGADLVGD